MARSEAAISILQFDGAALTHLAAAPEGDRFRVEAFATVPVDGPLSSAVVRQFADEMEVASEQLYTILPRHEVTVRVLTLPAREPAEITSMVELTASEYAPYPRESLVIAHRVLEELPSGESRVLLVLAQKEAVDRHVELLRGAGLEPRQIFLSTSCLAAAAHAAPQGRTGRYALVHLSASALEIAVFEEGVLTFTRGITHGAMWTFSDPHDKESMAYEVRDALSAYRRECDDGLGVSTILVAADGVDAAALASYLESSTEKAATPAVLPEGVLADAGQLSGAIPVACAGALIAAGSTSSACISLLPETLVRDRAMRGVQRHLLRGAALAAVVVVAAGCWFAQAVVQRVLLIRELRVQAEALAPSAEGVAAKQRSLQLISRQVDEEGGFLEMLAAVATAAPSSDFNVTRIEYDRETGMDIWGRARSKDLVLSEFLGNLRRLGEGSLSMLAHAHSQYETAGRERDVAVFDYHVTIPAVLEEEVDGNATVDR